MQFGMACTFVTGMPVLGSICPFVFNPPMRICQTGSSDVGRRMASAAAVGNGSPDDSLDTSDFANSAATTSRPPSVIL